MFNYKVIAFILLSAILASSDAYSQQQMNEQQKITIEGKVTYIDPETGVLRVQTDFGMKEFYISVETEMFHKTQPMTSIEIAKDDPIIIQYLHTPGKNVITKLVDNKPLY